MNDPNPLGSNMSIVTCRRPFLWLGLLCLLQDAMGQVLKVDIIHDRLPGYGRGLFCEFSFGPKQIWALVDTGSPDFFFVWKDWYEREVGVGSCASLSAGCYTCPSPCVPNENFLLTFKDGLEVEVFEHKDTVTFGSTAVPNVYFGLIRGQDPPPTEQDPVSILGLAPYIEDDFNSLLQDLADAKRIGSRTFAIYLSLAEIPKGKLLLGGGDPTVYKHPLQYVKLNSQEKYTITLSSIQVGDGYATIGINEDLLLDTGNNYFRIPQLHFDGLFNEIVHGAWKSAGTRIPFTWDAEANVWSFPCAYRSYLPPLRLGLGRKGDAMLTLSHANYVRVVVDECDLAISKTAEPIWVLPAEGFIGKYFEFQQDQGRVGFADIS